MDVIVFAIDLDQSRFKVSACLGEHSPKTGNGFAIEYARAVFGGEDPMYVFCKDAVSTVRKFLLFMVQDGEEGPCSRRIATN